MPEIKQGYQGLITPLTTTPNRDLRVQQREHEASLDYGKLPSLAIENQWLTSGAERIYDRSKTIKPDPLFEVTPDRLTDYEMEFDHTERDYMSKAKSEEEFIARVSWLREDTKRHNEIASYGATGVIAELTAGIFDPVGWGMGFLSGSLGLGAKASMLQRAVRGAATAAVEGVAYEAVLSESDTQRDADGIMFAATGGILLGGTIGAISRKGAGASMASVADEADNALLREAQQAAAGNPLRSQLDEVVDTSPEFRTVSERSVMLDNTQIGRTIETHATELSRASLAPLKGLEKGVAKKKIRALKKQAADIVQSHKLHKAKVASSFGAARNVTENARNQFRYKGIADIYEPQVAAIESQIQKLEDKLTATSQAKTAERELTAFHEMSYAQQVHKLYPKGAPKISETVERQIAAVQEVTTPPLTQEAIDAANDIGDEVLESTADTARSAGAMRVKFADVHEPYFTTGETSKEYISGLVSSMGQMPTPVNKLSSKVPDKLRSLFGTIDRSDNLAFRGLGHRLLENPEGNMTPEDSASILSFVYDKVIRGKVKNRYNEGFEEWSAAAGRGRFNAYLDVGKHRADFDKLVFRKIANPELVVDEHIAKAADGFRDGFKEALRIRKKNGELGFENIRSDGRYVPHILDGKNVNAAVVKTSSTLVKRVLAKGYMQGGIKLSEDAAEKLAEMQYIRTMSSTLSTRHAFEQVVSQAERERFLEELIEAGIEKHVVADFLESKELSELSNSVSNRAKHAIHINPESEIEGIRVADLLSTDMSTLSEAYFREAAGGAAMAKHGFKSQQQAMQVIDASEQFGRNLNMSSKRMSEEAEMLKDSVRMIYGQTIEADPSSKLVSGMRRLREYTGMIRLGQLGFAQFPEAARLVAHMGLQPVLDSIPSTAIFRRRAARGGKSSGDLLEPELHELEELLGYIGEGHWDSPLNIRLEEFGEGMTSELGRVVDNALAAGTRANAVMSGFQAVQGGLEKIAMKSIKKRLLKYVDEGMPTDNKLLMEAGLTPDFLEEFSSFVRANPKTARFNGRDVKLMNIEAMTPEMREKMMIGMTRMSGRMIQKNFIGDTSIWMNKWLGKTLTQFRAFSIVSLEKQLIHDVRGDKVKAAQVLAWSSLLGYISYGTQIHLQSLGDEHPDRFVKERMSGRALSFGVFNKLPQTASVSLGGDALATLGALPDYMYASPSRTGFRAMSGGSIAPSMGAIGDVVGLSNSLIGVIKGDVGGKEAADKARRLIPLGNAIGIGQMAKAGINLL